MVLPSGYRKVAEFQDSQSTTKCYLQDEERLLFIISNPFDQNLIYFGPIKPQCLESLWCCIRDVKDAKGNYNTLEDD